MKQLYLIASLFVFLCSGASEYAKAQLFVQNFNTSLSAFNSTSITTGTYANSAPTNSQFTALVSSGSGTNISVTSGKLVIDRSGNAGSFSRIVSFSPIPNAVHMQFDMDITTAQSITSAAVLYFGSNQSNSASAPSSSDVHSRLAFSYGGNNNFRLRDIASSTNGTNLYSGNQTITWVINNSGTTLTYTAPNGVQETVANDRWDAWVGTSREINEGSATTSTVSLSQFKYVVSTSTSAVKFDNMIIQPLSVQFRSKGDGDMASLSTWECSTDGTTWYDAKFLPAPSSGAITVKSGHNVTVSNSMKLDQLTVEANATLSIADGVTLAVEDGTGTDITINGTLNTNVTGSLAGAGSFALAAGATLKTGNANGFQTIGMSGLETFTAGANYVFNGATLQTLNNPNGLSANNFTLENSAGAKLNNSLAITGTLTLTAGDLDLNGSNVDLGTTGALVEDRTNNHLVLDNTATGDSNQGGGITFSGITVGTSTGEIRGTGLYLRRMAGADYTVSVTRKHYKGGISSRGGAGIPRLYKITGTPTGTNTIMRIYYAASDVVGLASDRVLYRWTAATGWQKAGDAGATFANGALGSNYVEGANINAFSDWTIGSFSRPLPISLLGVRGERAGEEVKISWETASEVGNRGFEVQVSADGLAYQTIGFVEGAGNSTSKKSYQFLANRLEEGYYRLKQLDIDGKFSFSPVVFVTGFEVVRIFPNPNAGTFEVQGIGDNVARLLDARGGQVWAGKAGKIQTNNLPKGAYFLHTTQAGKARIMKVIVE